MRSTEAGSEIGALIASSYEPDPSVTAIDWVVTTLAVERCRPPARAVPAVLRALRDPRRRLHTGRAECALTRH